MLDQVEPVAVIAQCVELERAREVDLAPHLRGARRRAQRKPPVSGVRAGVDDRDHLGVAGGDSLVELVTARQPWARLSGAATGRDERKSDQGANCSHALHLAFHTPQSWSGFLGQPADAPICSAWALVISPSRRTTVPLSSKMRVSVARRNGSV